MKTIAIYIIALIFSLSATQASAFVIDPPTSAAEKESEKNNKETENKKSEVNKTTKIINGKDLHKLKFPKKFGSKKVKYNYRNKLW